MSASRRSVPLPRGWRRTQQRILARDARCCYRPHPEVCIGHATEVDHIVPASQGGSDDDTNLAAICGPCHRRKTGKEAQAAQPQRKRPAERHPGRL